MIRLNVLGPVLLQDEAGRELTEVVAQPKRFALLAYLGLATPRGPQRRDTLLALFWPEYDDARARAALNRSVYFLRQHLGDETVARRGTEELALAPERVSCDAWGFDRALREGRLDDALSLYQADLLEGFHVSGSPEFDHWLEGERLRLRQQAEAAAWTLMERARADGDVTAAAAWARRAYRHAGALNEPALRRLLGCLADAGDRAGALREYESFAAELERELDAKPARETQAVAAEIRSRAGAVPSTAALPMPAAVRGRARVTAAVVVATLALAAFVSWNAWPRPQTLSRFHGAAASTTRSADALRAFAEGEAAYRSGQFTLALGAFQRAVQADSAFALGYLRLSNAANWTGNSDIAGWGSAQAVRLAAQLPPVDSLHVVAWDYYLRGHALTAEQLYRELVSRDSTDADAWARLADITYHWGPTLGRSTSSSKLEWDRVLTIDENDVGALLHRARIAASERDEGLFRRLTARIEGLEVGAEYASELALVHAFAFGDSAARRAAAVPLARYSQEMRKELLRAAAAASYDLAGVDRYLAGDYFHGVSFSSREAGEMALLAGYSLARGQLARAEAVLDSAAQIEPARILEYRAAVQATALLGTPARRSALRRELNAPLQGPGTAYHLTRPWRLYLAGLLAARDGDTAAASASEAALDRFLSDNRDAQAYAARFAALLAAERLRAAGLATEALAALGAPALAPDYRLPRIWSHATAHERFLRGELLADLGRDAEAMRWFETFPDPNGYDAFYLPAAELRQMELAGRMEDTIRAARHRERVAALLVDADVPLRVKPEVLLRRLN